MRRRISLFLSLLIPLSLLLAIGAILSPADQVSAHAAISGDGSVASPANPMLAPNTITATNDVYSTTEDVALVVLPASGVLTNDVNSLTGTLSAILLTPPVTGTVDLNLDGSFTYTPSLNFNGVTTFTYQATVVENFADMVAYWALDDIPSTTAYDYSGHGHLGTLVNGAAWVGSHAATTFPNPYALYVDGSNDYVTIPDDAALDFGVSDDFTVALWVKMAATQPDTTYVDNSIVDKWSSTGGFPFTIRYLNQTAGADSGKIQVVRYDGTNVPYMNSNATVNNNQFHHIAFVKSGAVLKLYIDGVLDKSITDTVTVNPANTSPLFLGQRGGGTNKFQGTLDDLRIYARSLSLAEIAQLAQGKHLGELSNPAVVTITVNAVNDAPITLPDVYTATKYTTLSVVAPGVLTNDIDLEGDAFESVLLTPPLSGTLTFQANGAFSYTPHLASSAYQTFTYAAVETTLGLTSTPTTVGLNILTPLVANNFSPAAHSHTASVTTTLTAGFTIPLSQTSVTSQSLAVHRNMSGWVSGTLTTTASSITYTPAQPFFPGELVETTILTNVYDTNGDRLFRPHVWRFQAGAGVGPAVFADNGDDFGDRWTNGSALGDVNQDGDLDLIAVYNSGMFVWANNGNGKFTFQNNYSLNGSNAMGVALGDLDGDRDLDMVIAQFGSPGEVWFNRGGLQGGTVGQFIRSAQPLGGAEFSTDLELGDVDGDGDLDAFIAAQTSSSRVWLNNGLGTFTDSGYNLGSHMITDVALGDVDGDGDLDAYIAIYAGANRVWLNNGAGVFFDSGQAMGAGYTTGAALGDVDGDGDLDAYVTNIDSPLYSRVYLNNGSGGFTDSGQTLMAGAGVALGDFDGDGDLDAFVIDVGPDRMLLNNGAGQFTDSGQSLDNLQSQSVSLGDVDADGDLDAFVGHIGYDRVWLNELSASLSLQKTASSSTVIPGEMMTYTLTFANGGPYTATNVTLTDTIPISLNLATLTVISSGVPLTPVLGSPYVWQVADLAPSASGVITITGLISSPLTAGPFSNQATIATNLFESNTSNNVSRVTTFVTEVPPVAEGDVYTTTEEVSLTVNALSGVMQNDYDINGNALTAILDTAPMTGALAFNADGSFVYTPTLDFYGTVTYTYQLAAAENLALMAGYWKMDDNALIATDSSGYSRTARLLDGYAYITTSVGHWTTETATTSFPNPYAVMFDGINDWGFISNNPAFSFGPDDDFAVAFWLKADTTQADVGALDNMLVSKYASYDNTSVFAISLLNQTSGVRDGRILVSRSDGTNTPLIESTATVNDNQYHHVAFVKNGDLLSLYIDGVLDGTITDTIATASTYAYSYPIMLGKLENYTRYFQGALDDVRIYGRGLSAADVTQLSLGNHARQFSPPAVVTLHVTPVNDAPVANGESYTVTEDIPLNISAPGVLTNDTDSDGDTLTAVLDTTTLSGTLTLNSTGAFSYTSNLDECGTDRFTYHAYDGQVATNPVTVTLNIICTNDAPVANDDTAATDEDTPTVLSVLSNDTDMNSDPLTITIVSTPTYGSVVHNGATLTYTPSNRSANYAAVFTYIVSDGFLTDTATVTVTVTADNDDPVAVNDSYTVTEDTTNNILTVLDNDSDLDGDSLSITEVSVPAHGTAVISGTLILYTPTPNFFGTDTFTYTVSDGTVTRTATVTLTVEDVPEQTGYTVFLPLVRKP